MPITEFDQLFSAMMTQNVLLAKLIRRIDTGVLPSDGEAFQYASEIYGHVLRDLTKISQPSF